MRFSTIAAFATSLAVVSAQTPDLSAVPNCAVSCLVAAVPDSGCSVTDVKCQCTTGQAALAKSVESCVPTKCSAEDAAKVLPALVGICQQAGISVSVPESATSAAASAASSAAGSMTSAASASHSASMASSMSGSMASRTSGAASATSGVVESTGAAVANAAGLGAVVLGLAAALL
ncbi:hypothetical protein N0V86_002346 [Didymella sp. IMI 355093]|nr:hypothetical protein N0V86_002346 [Didymella sp. IMI 355093]